MEGSISCKPFFNISLPETHSHLHLLFKVSKILEKGIYSQINEHLGSYNILQFHQFSFRNKDNTAITNGIMHDWQLIQGSKAFDTFKNDLLFPAINIWGSVTYHWNDQAVIWMVEKQRQFLQRKTKGLKEDHGNKRW